MHALLSLARQYSARPPRQGRGHSLPCLENPGKIPLHLIEVQSGSYLGEERHRPPRRQLRPELSLAVAVCGPPSSLTDCFECYRAGFDAENQLRGS